MTLPDERYRAIKYARGFMRALTDPKQTPRVPSPVRHWARAVLRHYPHDYEMEQLIKLKSVQKLLSDTRFPRAKRSK